MNDMNEKISYIITDPKIFGPGMWLTLHILGFNSNTEVLAKSFLITLKNILLKLPCKKCREHSLSFIENTNYNIYSKMTNTSGSYIGPFKYVCDLHNNANNITNNPNISWLKLYHEYNNITNICDGPCSNIETDTEYIIKNNILNKINHLDKNNDDNVVIKFISKGKTINKF